jgi:hypothetical protein
MQVYSHASITEAADILHRASYVPVRPGTTPGNSSALLPTDSITDMATFFPGQKAFNYNITLKCLPRWHRKK